MARRNFDTLDQFGKGSNLSTDLTKRLLDHLIAREILAPDLEEAQVPNRAPISYVYVSQFFFTCHAMAHEDPCSSGPRQRSFLRTGHHLS
jgi:hypothetical protein